MRFALTNQTIQLEPPFAIAPSVGGIVSFEGRVRNLNEGQSVVRLAYSAYEALAVSEGSRIVDEAIARFGLVEAASIHRIGDLAIGDVAVRVWVAAAHRGEAFAACQWIIDEVKASVPIWKHETYTDGQKEWVVGSGPG